MTYKEALEMSHEFWKERYRSEVPGLQAVASLILMVRNNALEEAAVLLDYSSDPSPVSSGHVRRLKSRPST